MDQPGLDLAEHAWHTRWFGPDQSRQPRRGDLLGEICRLAAVTRSAAQGARHRQRWRGRADRAGGRAMRSGVAMQVEGCD